ncbi:MAG: creatininase family protein [Planctomycetes bacterium]|nr:creatininase family protein [Planctomycetota bacterium]
MMTVENTWKEVEESGVDIVVIPIGAIEQHGHHLPLGTDFFAADRGGRMIAEKLNAYLLPALPFSNSQEHLDFKGSVSIRPPTLAIVVEEIILSLAHQGFRKFVICSSHGGNWVLKPTIRDINFRHPDLMVIMSHGTMPRDTSAIPPDIHSGKGETSSMMAYKPELVKEGAEDFTPDYGREYIDYVSLKKLSPTGVWGKPSEADPEQSKQNVAQWVDRSVEYIEATFAEVAKLKKQQT